MKTVARMLFLVIAFSLFFSQTVGASDGAEVFDIKNGEIILTIKNSNSLQNQVKEWLSSANGTVGSLKIEPSEGIAIKIPLMPPYKVNNDLISGTVTEVVMFISPSKTYFPTLLVFTKENGFVAVYVKNHNLKTFLKKNRLFNSELNLTEPSLR
ncbi:MULTISPECIES: hypothetical protein [unclassified Paenibacillus]|uniref:hypothetical protein n=1 Tax=unclassified Paenibacillus TaxID=185978 RepID=UPI0027819E69|nr:MULTISPECIES: hypothetical protein [unclassified Paenibacillus]MDQ0899436.1 hypothetical protein [Paenibacillus sp. V4I7]MDQ0914527.1 hypothetical protein [Paenibacillus sp. V4I5]